MKNFNLYTRTLLVWTIITSCFLDVIASPLSHSQIFDIHHRTRRRVPTTRDSGVVVAWLIRNLPAMGMELCNEEDPYEGIRCPGTDVNDGMCARWNEICDGVQKCGLRKKDLCTQNMMDEDGCVREVAEDKCSGEESKDACDIKEKEPPRCGLDYDLDEDFSSVDIMSPGYPVRYPGDLYCFWRVKGPPDSKLTVEFISFNSEANYDYINIGEGHKCDPVDRRNYLIYKHSGMMLPDPPVFNVKNNEIFASFHSDYHDFGEGFHMRVSLEHAGNGDYVEAIQPEFNTTCGGMVNLEKNGHTTISSPNYPNDYQNLYQCDWMIMLPKGRRLGLKFTHFVTEKKADVVSIGAGRKAGQGTEYSFSGNIKPSDILIIENNKGWVRFSTDDSNSRMGFQLQLFDYPINNCGGVYEIPRGGSVAVASPLYPFRAYRLSQQCLWVFTISNGRKLSVSFDDFSLSGDDILSVGSGIRPAYDWSNYIIREARGHELPRPKRFYVGKNAVWFYFRSNDAGIDRGFKAEIFDSTLYKPKKKPKKGKSQQPNFDCGGEITREDALAKITIQSPGYPGRYSRLMECYWLIDIPFGGDIRMKFSYLSLENHLDILTIGNGTNPNKKKTVSMIYSGFQTPEVYEGIFHQMWIRFNSDMHNEYGGFSLTIEPRPYITCGGELHVPADGSLALGSPGYPDVYPPNMVCRYVVHGPLHHRVSVSIAGFETETGKDLLTISEGCPTTDPNGRNVVVYQFSGKALPVNYQSLPRSNTIWIEFTTNERIAYHGFLINFADTPLKAVPTEGVGCSAYNRTDPADFIAGTSSNTVITTLPPV